MKVMKRYINVLYVTFSIVLFGPNTFHTHLCFITIKLKNMAKQKGPKFISGTINGLTYYKLNEKYYVRKKSTLSRRRVKRSPAFQRTMEHAELLAQASKLASAVYRMLPRQQQRVERYRALTGQAMGLLKEGLDAAAVKARLSGVPVIVVQPAGTQLAVVGAIRPMAQPVKEPKYVPVFCTGRPVLKGRRGRKNVRQIVGNGRSMLPGALHGDCGKRLSSCPPQGR
jgi:hypothetical protein